MAAPASLHFARRPTPGHFACLVSPAMPRIRVRGIDSSSDASVIASVTDRRRVRRERNATEDPVRLIGKTRRVEKSGQGFVRVAVAEYQ
jgi:hypothetical protein